MGPSAKRPRSSCSAAATPRSCRCSPTAPRGLKEQQIWADKYGTTLNQKTLKAQMDLVSAQRETKVAWLGLQVAFAKFVTPALEKANEQFQQIAAIMADDKLTDAEKWKRIGGIIEKWATGRSTPSSRSCRSWSSGRARRRRRSPRRSSRAS